MTRDRLLAFLRTAEPLADDKMLDSALKKAKERGFVGLSEDGELLGSRPFWIDIIHQEYHALENTPCIVFDLDQSKRLIDYK